MLRSTPLLFLADVTRLCVKLKTYGRIEQTGLSGVTTDTHLGRHKSISGEQTLTYFEKWPIQNCTSRTEQFGNSPKLCGVVP